MYLSRLELRREASRSPAFWRRFGSGYKLHQALWSLFGDRQDRERDFLYRVADESARPKVFTLSQRLPVDPDGLWAIASKPFAPQLAPGDRLRFSLRVNPVVTRAGRRHDLVMDAKTHLSSDRAPGSEPPTLTELAGAAGARWLGQRAEKHGFRVVEGTLASDGYRIHRFSKRAGGEVSFSTLDLSGTLEVTGPERFLAALAQGFGPAKGFGCGLMLLARTGTKR